MEYINKQSVEHLIYEQGVLPLFYCDDVNISLKVIKTLITSGIRVIEYTNRGKYALENLKKIKHELLTDFPDLKIGAGTIKTAIEAELFIKAGADFIVSPIISVDLVKIARAENVLYIPGCMTPTEIQLAHQQGIEFVKIFPANVLEPQFIQSIKELFPGMKYLPTGGVEISDDNIRSWFTAGASAVGIGSKLISKSIWENNLYEDLYFRSKELLSIINSVRNN